MRFTEITPALRTKGARSVSSGDYLIAEDLLYARSRNELFAWFQGRQPALDHAREHARDEGYSFMGPVSVDIVVDEKLRTGMTRVEGRMKEGPGGGGAGSLLLPTGERVVLGEFVVSVGRMPDSTVVLADPNVSRNHAEIRPQGDGYVVTDVGSTNGTRVNGVKVSQQELRDGDELVFGNTRMTFVAS